MMKIKPNKHVEKLETHIKGLDSITNGGLPKGRTTLVTGTAGSAKTVFACQFIAAGIVNRGEAGVFVTFEESPEDIRCNMTSFGWDIAQWETKGKWYFIDASPQPDAENVEAGRFDLGALIARIEYAVQEVDAKRLAMDSIGTIFNQFVQTDIVRNELFRIVGALKRIKITSVVTAERGDEYGDIARHGVEEFVADNVVIIRNVLEAEKRRRTIEILKYRGTIHQKGEYPFAVIPGEGVVVIPLSAMELKQRSSSIRISSGVSDLDEMCGGGFFRDSIVLVSGATGTGKTLTSTHFMAGAAQKKDRCLLFAFEESKEQLFRNAIGWGVNFAQMEKDGYLKVVCEYPESMGLEDHLIRIKTTTQEFKPARVAVDSFSALERVSTTIGFRQFAISLTSFLKHEEITGMYTATTPTLLGGSSVTEAHISTITDTIILLRYVEMHGEMHRGLTVLKMRGSMHNKDIREFHIDQTGLHIGKPFRNVSGILVGNPTHYSQDEVERLANLFESG